MMAVIGDSASTGSVGVHFALGFTEVARVEAFGWGFRQWRGIVIMQKTLGLDDSEWPGA